MAYNAPFISPYNFYQPNAQNGYMGQNYANNGYSMYNNQMQNTPNVAQSQQNNDMIWVLNKNEADAYPVAPNCTVTLWDKSEPVIYLKSMSVNGIPSMRIIDYNERTETAQKSSVKPLDEKGINYVTKDEITAINGKIDDLTARCDVLEQLRNEKADEKSKTTAKKSKGGDE